MKKLIIKLLTRNMNYREKLDLVKLIIGENRYEKIQDQINESLSLVEVAAEDIMNDNVIMPNCKFKELCDKGIFDVCDQILILGNTKWYRNDFLRESSKNLKYLHSQF